MHRIFIMAVLLNALMIFRLRLIVHYKMNDMAAYRAVKGNYFKLNSVEYFSSFVATFLKNKKCEEKQKLHLSFLAIALMWISK